MSDWNNLAFEFLAFSSALIGAQWAFLLWINKQFSTVKSMVYEQRTLLQEALSDKLEYHEQHDDRRFGQIRNDIWEIRLANAARYGTPGRDPLKIELQREKEDSESRETGA